MVMFFVVLLFMMVLVVLMSIGVIFGRKPISGSCGGMSAIGMKVACDVCKGDKSQCKSEIEKSKTLQSSEPTAFDLGHDALNGKNPGN